MTTHRCYHCKRELPRSSFGFNRTRRDGRAKHCFECLREMVRYSRAKGVKRDWSVPMYKAKKAVAKGIAKGILVRPSTCSKCGQGDRRIDGHHHNGYDDEHLLDVIWLCRSCHKLAHTRP